MVTVRACHDGRVSSPVPTGLSRRALLTGAGVGAVLLLASCTSGADDQPGSSGGQAVPPVNTVVDPLAALVATTRLHVLNLQAAAAIDVDRQALLNQLLEDRQAHLTALLEEWARTDKAASDAQAAISGQVPVPASAELAIGQVRTDASEARTQFTDVIGSVSRHRAALLGSIAANLETHRVVLA